MNVDNNKTTPAIGERLAGLIEEAQKFDPSDNYHGDDGYEFDARSYYAAIDRVVALLEGRIHSWIDPRQ